MSSLVLLFYCGKIRATVDIEEIYKQSTSFKKKATWHYQQLVDFDRKKNKGEFHKEKRDILVRNVHKSLELLKEFLTENL